MVSKGQNAKHAVAIMVLLFVSVCSYGQWKPWAMVGSGSAPPSDTVNAVWDAMTEGTYIRVSDDGDTATSLGGGCGRAFSTFSTGDTSKVFAKVVFGGGGTSVIGIAETTGNNDCSVPAADSAQYAWVAGALYTSRSGSYSAITPDFMGTYSAGDTIDIAIDYKNGAFYMGKNGVWENNTDNVTGDPTSGASRTGALISWTPDDRRYYLYCGFGPPNTYEINTGKYPSVFNPPTGYRGWRDPPPD